MNVFDFDQWCAWVDAEIQRITTPARMLQFKRGGLSPKRGATVGIETPSLLLAFAFWETGEADLDVLDKSTNEVTFGFQGRKVDDETFVATFRECLLTVESS